jgi:drug/metabolite transporter (DMT)-like permease
LTPPASARGPVEAKGIGRAIPEPSGLGRGLGAALLAVLIWGAQLPIAKGAFAALDSYSMTVVRYAPALVAFGLALLWLEGRQSFSVANGRQLLRVIIAGLAMGGSATVMFVGLSRTRPEIAVLILGLQPALTVIADWLIWRRRPPAFTFGCLVLAFLGVAVAVTRGGELLLHRAPAVRGEALGNLMVFCAALLWVTYVLLSTRLRGWSTMRVSALTSGPAVAVVLIAWAIAHAAGATHIDWALLPSASWRLIYVSFGGVIVAMFLWNSGASRIGAVNAMLLINLMPVITFAFRAFEGVSFAASEIVGAAMVVGALVANNLYLRRRG